MDRQRTCFRDAEGRVWNLRLTAATFFRMRREVGQLPPECVDPQRMVECLMRFDSFAIVLEAILRPQLMQADVTIEALLEALYGEYLEEAQMAFLEALADFFPNRAVREALRQAIEQAKGQGDLTAAISWTSGMTPSGSTPA